MLSPRDQERLRNKPTSAQQIVSPRFHGVAVPEASATAGVAIRSAREPKLVELTIALNNVAVSLVDATTAGAQGSVQIADLPPGLVRFLGAITDLTLVAGAGLATALVTAVGSAAAAADNATLTGTEANIVPSTAVTLTGQNGAMKAEATNTEGALVLDGTATAVDVFLNIAATDANSTGGGPFTVTVNGTITLVFAIVGDN